MLSAILQRFDPTHYKPVQDCESQLQLVPKFVAAH